MKFLSLFSGIGGFDWGLERAGMKCAGQVEIDNFCIKVLEKHFPNVKRIKDIKDVTENDFGAVDLVCGGFPCQPFSIAGKRKGKTDDRYLWQEMFRVIKIYKPTWVLGENVTGIVNLGLGDVLFDLESAGYEVQPVIIPACAVGAPHRRNRVWIIAYSSSNGLQNKKDEQILGKEKQAKFFSCKSKNLKNVTNATSLYAQGYLQKQGKIKLGRGAWWKTEPCVDRVADGIPTRVDRLKSLGNAVVPQIVEILGRLIMFQERRCS